MTIRRYLVECPSCKEKIIVERDCGGTEITKETSAWHWECVPAEMKEEIRQQLGTEDPLLRKLYLEECSFCKRKIFVKRDFRVSDANYRVSPWHWECLPAEMQEEIKQHMGSETSYTIYEELGLIGHPRGGFTPLKKRNSK